jgi:hypothetical protein
MRMKSVLNHSAQAIVEGALVSLLVVGLLAGTAFAGKGGAGGGSHGGSGKPSAGSGTGSVRVVMISDANGNGLPNWGDQITFTVSGASTSTPSVELDCRQSGTLVYAMSAGIYPDYPFTQTYTLRSNYWTGGAAACVATLYVASGGTNTILSTTAVSVGA